MKLEVEQVRETLVNTVRILQAYLASRLMCKGVILETTLLLAPPADLSLTPDEIGLKLHVDE